MPGRGRDEEIGVAEEEIHQIPRNPHPDRTDHHENLCRVFRASRSCGAGRGHLRPGRSRRTAFGRHFWNHLFSGGDDPDGSGLSRHRQLIIGHRLSPPSKTPAPGAGAGGGRYLPGRRALPHISRDQYHPHSGFFLDRTPLGRGDSRGTLPPDRHLYPDQAHDQEDAALGGKTRQRPFSAPDGDLFRLDCRRPCHES